MRINVRLDSLFRKPPIKRASNYFVSSISFT